MGMNMKLKGWKEFNESEANKGWVSDEEMMKLDPDLHDEIEEWSEETIFNWSTGLDNAEGGPDGRQADALQKFGERTTPDWNNKSAIWHEWVVYPDGSITCLADRDDGKGTLKDFQYKWKDEKGIARTGNFLEALGGVVRMAGDDLPAKGDNQLPSELVGKVRLFFRPGYLRARRSGLI